ncbi:hypothetical protein MTR_2g022150 [Medicago truncatula]|uniref:Uncharacterized protein n=1 Tax=Medicago truncatula TaxID=3880 RepID=A0A072V4L7_MEDTR|nr:hypothetical protein MTR_2g022150 [Medicago truncatula]
MLGHRGSPVGRPHRCLNNHTSERDTTLLPKTLRLWVLLLIRCSTFTFLSDVGHITHTCTPTLPLKCESIYSSCPPSSGSSLLACIVVVGFSVNRPDTACTVVAAFCATDRLPQSYPSSNLGFDTSVGSRGEIRGPFTSRLEQPHK